MFTYLQANLQHALKALLLLWLIGAPLFGQEQKLSVRTLALTRADLPELFLTGTKEEPYLPITWSDRQPAKPILTLYNGNLPLLRMATDERGQQVPAVAYQVNIPAGAREVLLLGWVYKGEPRFHAITDDFLSANFNHWLLINLSSKEIAFRIGKESKPMILKSTESKIYKIKADMNKGAAMLGAAEIRGKIRTFYSSYFPVKSARRSIVLFSDDGDKIRTKIIADHFLMK